MREARNHLTTLCFNFSVPTAIEPIASPDAINYKDATDCCADCSVVDIKNIKDKQESYSNIYEHHKDAK